jgi:hypothetical protein
MTVYDLYFEDRVRSVTISTGTYQMDLTAGSGPWKPLTYANVQSDNLYYCIVHENGVEWEVGRGQMDVGDLLYRDTPLSSSNGGAAVDFSAGNKEVFVTLPATVIADIQGMGERGGIPAPGRGRSLKTTSAATGVMVCDYMTGVREFIVCAFSATGGAKSKVFKIVVTDLPMGTRTIDVTVLAQDPSLPWTATFDTSADQIEVVGAASTVITWYVFERVLGRFE